MLKYKSNRHILSRSTKCRGSCEPDQSVKLKSVRLPIHHYGVTPKLNIKGPLITTTRGKLYK